MAKYRNKIADKLIELRATTTQSARDICTHCGITHDTLYKWIRNKPEFAARWNEAKEQYYDNLGDMAESAIATLLSKKEYEEITTEYEDDGSGQPKVKSVKKVKKVIMPNPAVTIFTAVNRKPGTWKQKQSLELAGKDGEPIKSDFTIRLVESGLEPVASEKDIDID